MAKKKAPAREGQVSEKMIDAIVDGAVAQVRKAPAVRTAPSQMNAADVTNEAAEFGGDDDRRANIEYALRAGVALDDLGGFQRLLQNNGRDIFGRTNVYQARAGRLVGAFVGHMVRAKGNMNAAFRDAKESRSHPIVTRALGESTLAGGGALVPVEISNDFLELLRETTAYLQGGPTRMSLATGTMQIPGMASGAAGTWVGEETNASSSEPTFRNITLSLRKMAALTPISNDLIAHSMPAVVDIVRQDLVDSAGVTIDAACIRGSGSAFQPLGLKGSAAAATTFNANATVNVANITSDLNKMLRLQHDQKVKMLKGVFLMSGRSFYHLMSLRDGNNQLVFAADLAQGKLMGKPVFVSHNIPDNVGGSNSEVYFVSYEHELFADGLGPEAMRVEFFENATYHNGSEIISGISQDQSVVRLVAKVDRASRQQGKNISLLEAVTWGA